MNKPATQKTLSKEIEDLKNMNLALKNQIQGLENEKVISKRNLISISFQNSKFEKETEF